MISVSFRCFAHFQIFQIFFENFKISKISEDFQQNSKNLNFRCFEITGLQILLRQTHSISSLGNIELKKKNHIFLAICFQKIERFEVQSISVANK